MITTVIDSYGYFDLVLLFIESQTSPETRQGRLGKAPLHVTRHNPSPLDPNVVFECEASWNLKSNVRGALLDPLGSGLWPDYPDAWSSDLHFLGGRFFALYWDYFCSFSANSCHLGTVGVRYLCTRSTSYRLPAGLGSVGGECGGDG